MKNKFVRIPVANHGLHGHDYSYPYANTFNFMDVCPVYMKPLYKGESDHPKLGMFSRLNPTVNPAFATGRYIFKAFFVPFKFVFRPYYAAMEGTEYYFKDREHSHGIVSKMPYVNMGDLVQAFIRSSNGYAQVVVVESWEDPYTLPPGADFSYLADGGANVVYYKVTSKGARVLKILGSLGYSLSFNGDDDRDKNVLPILSFIRVFADYYFPKQYVGNIDYDTLMNAIQSEDIQRNADVLLGCLSICSQGFYDDSFLTCAFDKPVGPNTGVSELPISLSDPTNSYPYNTSSQQSASPVTSVEVVNTDNANGTPSVHSNYTGSSGNLVGQTVYRLNQWILDSLQSLNNFVQRHHLAGGRLLDRALASRGVKLSNDVVECPYFLGENSIEIQIDAVENNTSDQLGDLAGKGIASTEPGKPMKFDCSADDDGLFIVVAFVKPDFSMPIYNDPWNNNVDVLDFYHAELDKIGPEAIPQEVVVNFPIARINRNLQQKTFGFLNRYYGEIAERPRLLGDFRLNTRGAESLNSYHTFRLFPANLVSSSLGVYHSYDFLASGDAEQFQRLFYSNKVDNMQLFIRNYGETNKYKLPLGDSYDWDDDEYNKKVTLLQSGNMD